MGWRLDSTRVRVMGIVAAKPSPRPPVGRNESKHEREVPIRTFGVGLMAIAAVAAGLVLSRNLAGREEVMKAPAGENLPSSLSLEALRAAGM